MKSGKYICSKNRTTGLISIFLLFLIIFKIYGCKTDNTENLVNKNEENINEKMSQGMLVEKITKYKREIDNNTGNYSKKTATTEAKGVKAGIKAIWEKIEGYYDLNKLVKIKLYPKPQYSQREREFYFQNGKLVYALDKNERQKLTDGKSVNPGNVFYFIDKKLISYILYNGSENKLNDIEQKLHELQLTYEAYEFMDILLNN